MTSPGEEPGAATAPPTPAPAADAADAADGAQGDAQRRARHAAELELVQRKAARMAAARRQHPSVWRHLAHVGVLGWLLILPLVGLLALGRQLDQRLQTRGFTALGLATGLLLGGYLVWRNVRGSLDEQALEDAARGGEAGGDGPPRGGAND